MDDQTDIITIRVLQGESLTLARLTLGQLIYYGEAKLHPKDAHRRNPEIGSRLAIGRALQKAGQVELDRAESLISAPGL